ncbi:hypothetical protein QJS04_geneDACA014169 [Acorus gramineus]|uniref:DRBM domain-containing protein n=1 Tax=Acorus gramineus TaxID=55184 RepID=A0AAV9B3D4_ACOGR|nr:hypothetical protein QJS04_geneDACA014169 [Acorus gramineus]
MDLFSGGVTAEDAVHVLIDGLLPLSEYAFSGPPSLPQKQAVARQMHAVVLLYNYYHRKQFPKLEYLDFEEFCKVSATARSNLLGHMKFMNMCGEEQDGGGLSVMEMMIMDACAVCTALDASKAAPNTEGWPVSKVVVLLIDPTKKNFLLQFCSITQGVWSPVEKRLDHTMEVAKDIKTYKKKGTTKGTLGNESPYIKDIFLKIAYSAVKENTGINEKDLRVLESHYAYSLSQAKTMARLYLMQYTKLVSEEMSEIPIMDVIRRERQFDGSLPTPDGPAKLNPIPTTGSIEIYDPSCSTGQPKNNPDKDFSTAENKIFENQDGHCFLHGHIDGADDISLDSHREPSPNKNATNHVQNMMPDQHLKEMKMSAILDQSSIAQNCVQIEEDMVGLAKKPSTASKQATKNSNGGIGFTVEKGTSTVDSSLNRAKLAAQQLDEIQGIGTSKRTALVPVVNLVNNPSSYAIKNGKHVSGNHNDDDRCAIQDGRLAGDLSLVSADFSSQQLHKLEASATKGDASLQITLIALQKKRYELEVGDDIAQCEMDIQSMLNGEENDSTLKIDSVAEECHALWSKFGQMCTGTPLCDEQCPHLNKRKRLSEAILKIRNPCQELDEICYQNNWILPRYNVLPSVANEGFRATVTIQGLDFQHIEGGDMKQSPREARESAAMHVLSELPRMAGQVK